jgi:hypothetical protein
MDRLHIFVGHDERESIGLAVFIASMLEHASRPIDLTIVTAAKAAELGIGTDGSTAFTKSRFAVAHWFNYRGIALWMDGADMMFRADPYGLVEHLDGFSSAVQVVKHDYTPRAARKYVGTEMESPNVAYPRKNWSSVMGMWCSHSAWRKLSAEYVASASGQHLHRFEWCDDKLIGELPLEWNWLDEYGENPRAKLVHYTNGIPAFAAYRDAPHAEEWRHYLNKSTRGMS